MVEFKTLRQLLDYKKVKVAEAAKLTGVSRQTLYTHLDRTEWPFIRTIRKVAAVFGAEVVVTFRLKDEGETPTGDELSDDQCDQDWLALWQAEDPDTIMTAAEVAAQLDQYEQQFGMSSEEFLRRVRAGTAPDETGIIGWKLLLKYR